MQLHHIWGMYSHHQKISRHYVSHLEQERRRREQELRLQRQRELWRERARNTVGDRASAVVSLDAAVGVSFRLVDDNGRTHGPRYEFLGDVRQHGRQKHHLVCDGRGRELWIVASVRVRIVARQVEDPHSHACRALKAAHRMAIRNDYNERNP